MGSTRLNQMRPWERHRPERLATTGASRTGQAIERVASRKNETPPGTAALPGLTGYAPGSAGLI